MGARIIGYGKALPGLKVPNEDLRKLVDTSDEWIVSRTGISSRRISINESTIDLACQASCMAMGLPKPTPSTHDDINVDVSGKAFEVSDPSSIDLLVLATITPDSIVPSSACAIKRFLGLENAIAFDINAACTGFIYALTVAESMMAASSSGCPGASMRNPIKRALVVSSERLSRLTDWQDRNTCVLFGDGAGACVLEWDDDEPGIIATYLHNTDDVANTLTCRMFYDTMIPFDEHGICVSDSFEPQGGKEDVDYSRISAEGPGTEPAYDRISAMFDLDDRGLRGGPNQSIFMNGQAVFKFAAKAMESAVREVLEKSGLSIDDIKMIIPHQANIRILEFAAKRLKLPLDRFKVTISETGNTSSSCLPMALSDAIVDGDVKKGDYIVLVAFGGGLTSGAALIRV